MMKVNLFLWMFFGFLIFSECSTGKGTPNSVATDIDRAPKATYISEDTGIVFVMMKIYLDSVTHSDKITVKDKIYTSGRVKSHLSAPPNLGSYITCVLYYGDKFLDSVKMEHPLHRHAEYFEEGGKMSMKEIHQKEAEFSVRFQLKGKGNKIKVFETLNRSKSKELITIQL